jgi:hypothetical protein
VTGFAIRTRVAGHPGRSAKTHHAPRLKPDHPIGAGQGERTAAFTGNHGRFWLNRIVEPVTDTLRTARECSELKAPGRLRVWQGQNRSAGPIDQLNRSLG